ncbi:NAD(+) synthase [bacterium]|nr:NAD(+) synthase [bacterium]
MPLADDIVAWMQTIVRGAGAKGLVVGLSGGIDSAVVAALAHHAFPEHTLCAILPCESAPDDASEARLFCRNVGIERIELDLSAVYQQLAGILPDGPAMGRANIKPRLRMIALYHLAATRGALVGGTSNRTEILIGYSTKHGDAAADLLPIGGLLKREVYALAEELGVPESILQRTPSAGLWPGQTDEAEIGMTYAVLDDVITAIDREEPDAVAEADLRRVRQLMRASAHKRQLPPVYRPAEG